MKTPKKKPGGPKLPRHDWLKLAARFIEGNEFVTLTSYAEALAVESKTTGTPAPAASLLLKRAAAENWLEKRLELVEAQRKAAQQQIVSRGAASLVEMYTRHVDLGQGLLAIGARWIMTKEQRHQDELQKWLADRAAGKPVGAPPTGAVSTVQEAAMLVRIGALLQRYAQESLAGLKGAGPKGSGAHGGPDDGGLDGGNLDPSDPAQAYGRLARLLEQDGEAPDLEQPESKRKTGD